MEWCEQWLRDGLRLREESGEIPWGVDAVPAVTDAAQIPCAGRVDATRAPCAVDAVCGANAVQVPCVVDAHPGGADAAQVHGAVNALLGGTNVGQVHGAVDALPGGANVEQMPYHAVDAVPYWTDAAEERAHKASCHRARPTQ